MDSRAVRHFVRKYGSRDAVAVLDEASLCVRDSGLVYRTEGVTQWLQACERCFVRRGRVRLADSRSLRSRLCTAHARKSVKKKRRLDEGNQSSQKRPRRDTVAPVSSAVQLWLQRLASAEPFVSKRPGVKMLQHYGAAFKVVDDKKLVFKEWRAGAESADRPACELCYMEENLATVATVCQDREWPTACIRHATPTDLGTKPNRAEGDTVADDEARTDAEQREEQTTAAPPEQARSLCEPQPTTKTTKERRFVCEHCNKRFVTPSKLRVHVRTHSGERPYACSVCGRRFVQLIHLSNHSFVHGGDKPFACKQCPAKFARASLLAEHERIHEGSRPFVCDQCNATFVRARNLNAHRLIHTGTKPFRCNKCPAAFTSSANLTTHKRVHTGIKPFACDQCGKRFAQSGSLKSHIRIHTGETPFSCDLCQRKFAHSSNLRDHRRIHTGEKRYGCTQCTMSFVKANNLKSHIRIHSGERPYQCHVCAKKFVHPSALKSHLRTHSGDRPYQCPECKQTFTQSNSLTIHLRSHSGDRPYQCNDCSQRFVSAGHLRQHERRHEESKRWKHACNFASFSTATVGTNAGLVECTTRCRDLRMFDDHVQRCHTSEGIAKRFKSEHQLADFLAAQGWAFDRDFANAIFYKHCNERITPITGNVSARPDFHLLNVQSLPADRKCLLLLCNDEFAHRHIVRARAHVGN